MLNTRICPRGKNIMEERREGRLEEEGFWEGGINGEGENRWGGGRGV